MNKNIYHRYLKLPMEHKKPACFNTQPENTKVIFVDKQQIDQDVIDWIESRGVIVSNVIEGIYTAPRGGKVHMHNDTQEISNAIKINFTWGPLNSTTRWWRLKEGLSFEIELPENTHIKDQNIDPNVDVKQFLQSYEQDCDLVYEQVIHTPSLMNVGQLHNTHNPDAKMGRWTLSYIILKSDNTHLQFEEALEIFKDVTYE